MPSIPTSGFGHETYGSSFADVYNGWYSDSDDAAALSSFVGAFGPNQRILELGIGTGRLATVLASGGHNVVGIDTSLDMLNHIDRATGAFAAAADMVEIPVRSASCDLVVAATNTLFNLDTGEALARCIEEARRVLRRGGRLLVETAVPGESDPALDRLVTTKSISIDQVVLVASIRNDEDQTVVGSHIEITEAGIKLRPWRIRLAGPEELDRLAALAGFRLGERVADWQHTPFDEHSMRAVSVYVAV